MRQWIWILECLVVVARNFVVDFSEFLVRRCYGGDGWWFVGCCGSMVVVDCGSVVGSVGWFGGSFLFSSFVVFQY